MTDISHQHISFPGGAESGGGGAESGGGGAESGGGEVGEVGQSPKDSDSSSFSSSGDLPKQRYFL